MLRQLWRLSQNLEINGINMSAPAIYAEYHDRVWHLEKAQESGYEGVACVDDTARLAVLLLRAYERYRLPWALAWGRSTLEFVLYMQQSGGNFANFILNWQGQPNLTGPTSRPGGTPWLARALWALSVGYRITREPRYLDRYQAAFRILPGDIDHADILAVVALSVLEIHAATFDPIWLERLDQLCEQVFECQRDGVLLNHRGEITPHLWGFVQPAALCLAARLLSRPVWIDIASETARRCLEPAVRSGFQLPRTMPYEVSSTAHNYNALHLGTGNPLYAELAAEARLWFRGRNAARAAVYNEELGMVFDGIDGEKVNANSGAESNIEGALALFSELPWRRYEFS